MNIIIKAVRIVAIAEMISFFGPPLPIPNRRNEPITAEIQPAVKLAPMALAYCERTMTCP